MNQNRKVFIAENDDDLDSRQGDYASTTKGFMSYFLPYWFWCW